MRNPLLIIILGTIALLSCKSTQQSMAGHIPENFELVLKRTACLGTCPFYELRVTSEGKVYYNGKGNVALIGEHQKQLPPEKMVAIKEVIASSDFWEYEAKYDDPRITDLPSVMMSCTIGESSNSVISRIGGPKEFGYLVLTLEKLIGGDGYDPITE